MNKANLYQRIVKYTGGFLIILSSAVMCAWIENIQVLKSFISGLPVMKFTTALNFMFIGFSMLFMFDSKRVSLFFAFIVMMIGAFSFGYDLVDIPLVADDFFKQDKDIDNSYVPIRMASTTSFCFLLVGIALCISSSKSKKIKSLNQFVWHLISLISFLAVIGSLFNNPVLYRFSFLSSMALNTSILLVLVSLAGSLIHYDKGITGLLTGDKLGDVLAKLLLPSTLVLIIILGLLGILSHRYNFVSLELGMALLAISFGIVSIVLIYLASHQINAIDNKRAQAENELLRLNKDLESRLKERTQEALMITERLETAVCVAEIGVYEVDFSKHMITMNQIQADIFGYAGQDLTITIELFRSFIHVEDLPIWMNGFAELKRPSNDFSCTCRIIRPSGELRFVQSVVTMIKAENGTVSKYIGVNLDITQQRLLEDKFIEIAQTLESVTKDAKIGIWAWDIKTNKLVWNEEMFSLYGVQSIGRTGSYQDWKNNLHPEDAEHAQTEINLALAGTKDFNAEFRVVWPDKSVRFIQGSGVVHRDTEGNPLRMVGTNRDITDSKNTATTLVELSKELEAKKNESEQLAFIASHDLQEPLRIVDSMVEYIQTSTAENADENIKTSFNFIYQSTQRMRVLINDLLELSKVGKNASLQEVDLTLLTNNILHDLSTSISQSGAVIYVGELPTLKVYEAEFRSLLHNLISNAIKYRKPNVPPEIAIISELQNGYWKFSISDNGIGFDEVYKDKVFAIFQRLHRKNEYEGTGIGLAHCKKIVLMHKGEIWLKSQTNQGSVFYFTIKSDLL
jgi:PAS domain S-box-containing protein